MKRIRVLIVDGSSTMRQTLSRLLDRDRELEVVGATASGVLGLAKLIDLRPDLVLLDVAPPDKEGLKTLTAMRDVHPTLPIIMFSRLTERGSQTTVDALLLGASDYVTKPESGAELELCVQGELTAKIKSLGASNPSEPQSSGVVDSRRLTLPQTGASPAISGLYTSGIQPAPIERTAEVVAIAASTGGPNALARLLSLLPAAFVTPLIIVQHMASGFTNTLAESLRRQTGRNVREVETAQSLAAASAWIAPGGRHLVVSSHKGSVQVAPSDEPPENDCRPSADVMLRSVAEVYGSHALAVVLTGMGCDGLAGCRSIRQAGGTVLVQDEASSIAWGMPGQVAAAGQADMVLPLHDLPQEIVRRTAGVRRASEPSVMPPKG